MRGRTRSSSQAAGVPDVVPYCRDTFSLSAAIPRRSAQQAVHAHLEPHTGLNMLQQHRPSHGDMQHQQQHQQQCLFLALPTTAAPSDQQRLSHRRQLPFLSHQQQHRTSINCVTDDNCFITVYLTASLLLYICLFTDQRHYIRATSSAVATTSEVLDANDFASYLVQHSMLLWSVATRSPMPSTASQLRGGVDVSERRTSRSTTRWLRCSRSGPRCYTKSHCTSFK